MGVPLHVDLNSRFKILTSILFEHHKYGQGIHTRIVENIIYNNWICVGCSKKGKGHMEHVVPLAFLIEESKKMYAKGCDQSVLEDYLRRNLKVVAITKAEAKFLDSKYKTTMPDNWNGQDPFARLTEVGIEWTWEKGHEPNELISRKKSA